jgi:hypothetical protein
MGFSQVPASQRSPYSVVFKSMNDDEMAEIIKLSVWNKDSTLLIKILVSVH